MHSSILNATLILPQLKSLNTNISTHFRSKQEDEPASVIHAPQGYMNFVSSSGSPAVMGIGLTLAE